jgi:zinc protease
MIWYRVGSRNERPGLTGVSHWVEHMMFKGTPSFPDGMLDRLVSREGGHWNAFTWLDFTAYYETMPADRIDLSLRLEADRMVNMIFSEEKVESERTVILSERGMYENDPQFLLNEELASAAFRVHPYHHETIGDEIDLKTMTREDLFAYYRKHYVALSLPWEISRQPQCSPVSKSYSVPYLRGNQWLRSFARSPTSEERNASP